MKAPPEPPRRARLRRLSDEEIDLWIAVARGVEKHRDARLPTPARSTPKPAPEPEAREKAVRPPAEARRSPAAAASPLQPLDRKQRRALSRGQSGVDGALDLHGMNQAEAHRALRGWLTQAQAEGKRLVIIVTGKGAVGEYEGPGVLRRMTPHWLRAPDLRGVVLGFEEAGRAHGGSGALYVRLRRPAR